VLIKTPGLLNNFSAEAADKFDGYLNNLLHKTSIEHLNLAKKLVEKLQQIKSKNRISFFMISKLLVIHIDTIIVARENAILGVLLSQFAPKAVTSTSHPTDVRSDALALSGHKPPTTAHHGGSSTSSAAIETPTTNVPPSATPVTDNHPAPP